MLAEKIRKLRADAGMSQEQLAEALCVSRQAITRWETSAGTPDIDNMKALARFFGISLDELLENDNGIHMQMVGSPKPFASTLAAPEDSKLLFDFPVNLPSCEIIEDSRPAFFAIWREGPSVWRLSAVGEADAIAEYRHPDRTLDTVIEKRVIGRAICQDTEGVVAIAEYRFPDAPCHRREQVYIQIAGTTSIPHIITVEYPGKGDESEMRICGLPEGEIRRAPQYAYAIENGDHLVALSPEYEKPGFVSWSKRSFEIDVANSPQAAIDVAGRFSVKIGGTLHDCMRIVEVRLCGLYQIVAEHYINGSGKSVLNQQYFSDEARKLHALGDDFVTVNGVRHYHAFDSISALSLGANLKHA